MVLFRYTTTIVLLFTAIDGEQVTAKGWLASISILGSVIPCITSKAWNAVGATLLVAIVTYVVCK